MMRSNAVLVLGAYGLVGREIVALLVDKTRLQVIASGRDQRKLAAISPGAPENRLERLVLDVFDAERLKAVCERVDLVINCVGPYSMGGCESARASVESGASYIDFANEQVHYRRLKQLDDLARTRGVLLLTAAGAIPGLSGVLMMQGAERLSRVESIEAFYAQGRMPDPGAGLGSLMSGALEVGFNPVSLRDGVLVPARLGQTWKCEGMPQPLGPTKMMAFPTIETLTVSERVKPRFLETYFAISKVPPGFFTLMRLAKPHKRAWAYRLLRKAVAWMAKQEYAQSVRQGLGPEAAIKVVVRGGGRRWEASVTFRDGGIATAYLPVVVAKRLSEGQLTLTGLATPIDLPDKQALWNEMAELGLKLPVRTRVEEDRHA